MKRFATLVLVVCMIVVFSGCNENGEVKKYEMKYGLNQIVYNYGEISELEFSKEVKESKADVVPFSDEKPDDVNTFGMFLVDFINSTYDLNWEYQEITAYWCNFNDVNESYNVYAAMSDPKNHCIFFNANMMSDYDVPFRLVHELIHCLRYDNIGKYEFALYKKSGYIGYYVGEAATDALAIRFLNAADISGAKEYFYSSSGYCYTTLNLFILEYAIPNVFKYYLVDDVDTFRAEFNAITEKKIVSRDREFDYFEQFLYQADFQMQLNYDMLSDYYQYGKLSKETYNNLTNTLCGNMELVSAMVRGSNSEKLQEVLDLVRELERTEGESSSMLSDLCEETMTK